MDSEHPLIIPLNAPGEWGAEKGEQLVGGKADKLAQLARAGFKVPRGFCLSTRAYREFLKEAGISAAIRMELGRKPMGGMRWEEIWDAALRIRGLFLEHPLPDTLRHALIEGLASLDPSSKLAVRSSAIGEDAAGRSFAGLHESIIGVQGLPSVEHAIRLVWASLWSDAALLYRKELGLDPAHSCMAVIVQEMVDADRSGVAFARDPRDISKAHAIIESVPGPCSQLVDGLVDPDHWELDRETGAVISWLAGQREEQQNAAPLLDPHDLQAIMQTLSSIEALFHWFPDMEWTGRSGALTVLQARPITSAMPDEDEKRSWYLELRPSDERLKRLRKRVVDQLIPELEAEGIALAAEKLEGYDNRQLAAAMEQRAAAVERWKKIYWDDFIPFAHGVRRLAIYYNDALQPQDPYEFVGLLRGQPMLAARRNQAIGKLARQLAASDALRTAITASLEQHRDQLSWPALCNELASGIEGAESFIHAFNDLNEQFLDITYNHQRLNEQPEALLRNILELSQHSTQKTDDEQAVKASISLLQQRLLDAVGAEHQEEALQIIETGRVSWKLRDDDNLLVARLESQLLRALAVAAQRLRELGRLSGAAQPTPAHLEVLVQALREPASAPIILERSSDAVKTPTPSAVTGESPRQLIGQPASPGVGTGTVRCIHSHHDLGQFQQGEVLVCEAIEPMMTHLVPLASAIIESRGGMLIHGAIIARELGIPCVNGVRKVTEILNNGDLVTVDGHMGIVAVGAPEFDLELSAKPDKPAS